MQIARKLELQYSPACMYSWPIIGNKSDDETRNTSIVLAMQAVTLTITAVASINVDVTAPKDAETPGSGSASNLSTRPV